LAPQAGFELATDWLAEGRLTGGHPPFFKMALTDALLAREAVSPAWLLTRPAKRRIVLHSGRRTHTMSVMCSLAACKAQTGMCGHEKAMLSVAVLAAIGLGAYFLMS